MSATEAIKKAIPLSLTIMIVIASVGATWGLSTTVNSIRGERLDRLELTVERLDEQASINRDESILSDSKIRLDIVEIKVNIQYIKESLDDLKILFKNGADR